MTTTACAEDWREMYEKAAREARDWRENFNVLQRALVGETGASGIEVAHKLRKDAERYRWHKARNPSSLLANAWGESKAACSIGDDPDAAIDVAMADRQAVGAANVEDERPGKATENSARAERDALRQDAERWRAALSAYERGVVMSHDGRTGEKDGYVTLFLQALRERNAGGA